MTREEKIALPCRINIPLRSHLPLSPFQLLPAPVTLSSLLCLLPGAVHWSAQRQHGTWKTNKMEDSGELKQIGEGEFPSHSHPATFLGVAFPSSRSSTLPGHSSWAWFSTTGQHSIPLFTPSQTCCQWFLQSNKDMYASKQCNEYWLGMHTQLQ